MVVNALFDLAELSSGEKAVSRVSGVPSCLYESAPPADEWGEAGLKDPLPSRACDMLSP